MKAIIGIACFVLLTPSAFAQSGEPNREALSSITGNTFLTVCDSTSSNANIQSNLFLCRAYLGGVFQGVWNTEWHAVKAREGEYVDCSQTRDRVTNQQLLDVVLKYLRDNPARRDGPIAVLAYEAIEESLTIECTAAPKDEVKKKKSSDSGPSSPSASNIQTITTFRGHTLGESWREFITTEAGLCQSKSRAENCAQAAAGKKADITQFGKDGAVIFTFEYGRFASATTSMNGPSFADLTYFEKTYGKPYQKFSHPERGAADSYWYFSDGGEAHAEETQAKSDEFTIMFTIQASDYAMRPGPLSANSNTPIFNGHSLGESWEKLVRTGAGLCRLDEDNAKNCKDAAAGKYAILVGQSVDGRVDPSFTFRGGNLMEASFTTSVSKFEELDDLDKTYGRSYYMTSSPEDGFATARWDYSDGGQILATEMFVAPKGFTRISAKTVLPH